MAAGSPAITASFDGSPYRVGGIRFAPKLISIWGAAVSRAVDQRDASSDAVSATLDVEPEVASKKILHHEIVEGKDALERPTSRLFLSGLSAGLEIGFSLFLMGVMRTLTQGQLSNAVVELLSANMYSFGFVLVILGRSEFFTEQTSLAVLPVLNREASVRALLRLWAVVYVGNLIGAAAFAWLAVITGPRLGMISPDALGTIANNIVNHSGRSRKRQVSSRTAALSRRSSEQVTAGIDCFHR